VTADASRTITLTTDQASYKRGQTVRLTATVTKSGAPVANVGVTFTITAPDGSSTVLSHATNASGQAKVSFSIKSNAPTGAYAVSATVTPVAGAATTRPATAGFTVQ
jgi:uncharacterized protein YfaS (alpha-2-macroglobulin family)